MKGDRTAAPGEFASVQERRVMKKVAQPEHAYTGCVPYTPADDESDFLPTRKNPPILGYRGHLRHDEDRIGTTFTQGLSMVSRAEPILPLSSAKARPPNNQPRQVRFAEENRQPKPSRAAKPVGMSPRSGYGQFDNASGYGNFAAPPATGDNKGMSPRSGYGAFDNASGYGAFAAPPAHGGLSSRSGYGEFENASGYGAFAAPPPRGNMSPRSGYGAFDNASGYGAFAAPPGDVGMSARSGYGEFDNASGYGAFAAPPHQKAEAMSHRSGYGAFENASGYGEFAAPPPGMSPRSGYGKFDDASGYGNFASPPAAHNSGSNHTRGYTAPQGKSTLGQLERRNPVDNRRENYVHPSSNQTQEQQQHRNIKPQSVDPVLHAKYQHAINRVGGEQTALRLWFTAAQTIWQRHAMRTELLQAVKRSFEKHERANHGFMTKAQLKEALRDLGCVFTDDQITALFGMYDKECVGTLAMSDLLVSLTDTL
ncbi:hypothetical protein PRIC1_008786 [Phytophthora ramorum]